MASFLEGGDARPHFSAIPMARRGPSGLPTVVSNAETLAQVGWLVRPSRDTGTPSGDDDWPDGRTRTLPAPVGSRLFTLVGAVEAPGQVLEVVGRATIGEVVAHAGVTAPPAAVLVGGYAGVWVDGRRAWTAFLDGPGLQEVGAQVGCGLLGVLPHGRCGVVETASLVEYLAAETAGQCGPCVHGLPRLARAWSALARGRMHRRALVKLRSLAATVDGSGACSHPDGVVRLIRSALDTFAGEVEAHLARGECLASAGPAVLSVPTVADQGRVWR